MPYPVAVKIEGKITIDDSAAEVLDHLCSYDLAEFFAEKRSHRFTAEQIKERLWKLRCEVSRILEAKRAAELAIVARFKEESSPANG